MSEAVFTLGVRATRHAQHIHVSMAPPNPHEPDQWHAPGHPRTAGGFSDSRVRAIQGMTAQSANWDAREHAAVANGSRSTCTG